MKTRTKKLTSILLAAVMMFSLIIAAPVTASAETLSSGDFEYEVLDDGTAEITGYTGEATELEIPSEIDGYAVTGIGWYAFKDCTNLTSVTIPDSVTIIEERAFFGCTSLESITISDSVTSIGNYAFRNCTSLASITIPDSVTSIGSAAFSRCTNLTSITIPDSVTIIEDEAFDGCTSLESVLIGNVTSIGSFAFEDCTSLVGITLPDGVTSIGYSAFRDCTSLESVIIPDSVTSIGTSAFFDCTSLKSITIPDSVTEIGSGAFDGTAWYDNQPDGVVYAGKVAYRYKGEMPENTSIELINGTKAVADSAFYGCTNLAKIIIPDSVTNIDYSAFSGCTGLTSITIPDSVTSIGWYAFCDCTSLASITIPDSVTKISNGTFVDCTNLKSITIPDSVTSIGGSAFSGCTSLTSVTIPESVSSIGWSAFEDCTNLTNITIPESVSSIGWEAFHGCTNLESITIPNSVTEIGTSAFENCTNLASITITDSVTSIGEQAFDNTAWYDNQPDGVVYIGKFAYGYKGEMPENTSIVLVDGTKGIVNSAFHGYSKYGVPNTLNTNLVSVTIPDSVTSISSNAFSGCTNLASITIPDSVTEIESNAFSGTAWYDNQPDGVVYAGKVAYEYKGEMPENTSIELKEGTKAIADFAFYGCTNLEKIIIPDSVISIDGFAFSSCENLASVTIPDSVTSIGDYAFGYYYFDDVYCKKNENFTITGYTGTAAEKYANNNSFTFISLDSLTENTYTDELTGISVKVDNDAELVARKLTDSETAEKAGFALGDGEEAVEIYDISLTKDGVTVQPDGTATVKLPASSENLRVYRLESNGTLTDMNAVYEDGYLIFTTDHFSVYIVARQQSEEMLIGDVNEDTILDVNDVTYLQKYLAHYNDSPIDETDSTQFAIADFNGDGTIDINDVTAIQMKLAGYYN